MMHNFSSPVIDILAIISPAILPRSFTCDHDIQVDEIVEHSYLFLKVQLHLSTMPPHSGILHGTMIGLCHTAPFIRALVIPFFPFPSNRSVHIYLVASQE
ncbi:hypothetical protein RYX36_011760, partial [Vicia faba]